MSFLVYTVAVLATISPVYEMQVLVSVVERGSFTSAARFLDLPKSSVSRRVSQLEERLGVRLMYRSTRSLRLTAAGEAYYREAVTLLSKLRELEDQISGFSSSPRGSLKISCPASFVCEHQRVFSSFLERCTEVRLKVVETDRYVDLISEGFDLALRGGRAPDPSLHGEKLISSDRILVASPVYQSSPLSHPTELLDHSILLLSEAPTQIWTLVNRGKKFESEVVGRVVTNNLRTLKTLAEAGLGLALLPEISCRRAMLEGRLLSLLPQWTSTPAELWAITPTAQGLSSAVRAFIEHLKGWTFETL